MSGDGRPPSSLEEILKRYLIPPRLYIRLLAGRALRKGERELALVPFLSDPARTSIDVGANKGVYAYHLAQCARRVICFEPNPKMFATLQRLAPAGADLHQVALSNADGEAELRIPRSDKGYSNQGASLSATKVADDFMAVTVPARTLDSYGLDDVGFIKIDVEGHEREVLEGARATVARCRPALLIEIEQIHTHTPIEDSIAFVESLGYACLFLSRGGLRSYAGFDPEANHRAPKSAQDYVFNFVFLPR